MSITLSGDTWTIGLTNNPLQQYSVEYRWSLLWNELKSCYKARDYGYQFDFINVHNLKFWVNEAGSNVLSELIDSSDYMRGELFTLDLGETPTGVFPGSPLHGDVGEFGIRILDVKPSGILDNPFKYFEYVFSFAVVSHPDYILPNLKNEGLITIGTLTNAFRWPLDGFKPSTAQGLVNVQANGGLVYSVDSGRNSDLITTEFICQGSAVNTGWLVEFMRSTRGSQFTLGVHENYYPFGANYTDTSFSVSCVNEYFEIEHNGFDDFKTKLKLWKR